MKTLPESADTRREIEKFRLALVEARTLLVFDDPDAWETPLASAQDHIFRLTFAITRARNIFNSKSPSDEELAEAKQILNMSLAYPFIE